MVYNATRYSAGLAHPVERLLPKQKVAGPSPVTRSTASQASYRLRRFFMWSGKKRRCTHFAAPPLRKNRRFAAAARLQAPSRRLACFGFFRGCACRRKIFFRKLHIARRSLFYLVRKKRRCTHCAARVVAKSALLRHFLRKNAIRCAPLLQLRAKCRRFAAVALSHTPAGVAFTKKMPLAALRLLGCKRPRDASLALVFFVVAPAGAGRLLLYLSVHCQGKVRFAPALRKMRFSHAQGSLLFVVSCTVDRVYHRVGKKKLTAAPHLLAVTRL